MRLEDLRLKTVTFEARYPGAFLLWDRSGQVWSQMLTKHRGLVLRHAEPGKVVFVKDQRIDLVVEVQKLIVIDHGPESDISGLSELATDLVKISTECLDISVFTRIGLRAVFWRSYDDRESASEAMRSTGMIVTPSGKQLGVSGDCLLPEYSVRKEDETNGFSVRLKAEGVQYKMELPPDWHGVAEPLIRTDFGLSLDVDYFTTADIGVGQFRASDWMPNALHSIRRDSSEFMGGD